jgi:Mor family transcriptional regulator
MKRNLLWAAFILTASGVGFAAYLPGIKKTKEIPVAKTISFSLYKGSNYNSKAYKESSVQIDIIIEKVNEESRTKV